MAKQKELKELKRGLYCAVNALPDSPVYRIEEVLSGHVARLSYISGSRRVGGGDMYGSMLYQPTPEQIKNSDLIEPLIN